MLLHSIKSRELDFPEFTAEFIIIIIIIRSLDDPVLDSNMVSSITILNMSEPSRKSITYPAKLALTNLIGRLSSNHLPGCFAPPLWNFSCPPPSRL